MGEMATAARRLQRQCWSELSVYELSAALRQLEEVSRQMDAIGAAGAAEVAARAEGSGRSAGSAATALGRDLGLTAGQCRSRIEAGRREGSPAMDAHRQGRITAGQERAIGEAVAELPDDAPEEARRDFSRYLTEVAESGASVRAITSVAARELAQADPGRLERIEAAQQKRRELRSQRPGLDGVSSVGITCEPRLQALLAAAIAKFGGPGQCIAAPVDPETGESADRDAAAADDSRSAGQRAYDALCHVLALGLEADATASRGVSAIVVRLTAEQLDAVSAGETGGLTETDAGVQLTSRQAVSLAGRRSWFLSALRQGREELRRIDIDRGRNGRLAAAIQRLVLYAAHGGCTFPGCEQSAAKCQGHHMVEWSRGGPTTVDNLALVCPIHHGWIGDGPGQWRTVPDPERPGMPRWIAPGTPAMAA